MQEISPTSHNTWFDDHIKPPHQAIANRALQYMGRKDHHFTELITCHGVENNYAILAWFHGEVKGFRLATANTSQLTKDSFMTDVFMESIGAMLAYVIPSAIVLSGTLRVNPDLRFALQDRFDRLLDLTVMPDFNQPDTAGIVTYGYCDTKLILVRYSDAKTDS